MLKKQRPSLIIRCCGVQYSPKSPETYWFFNCYQNDYTDNPDKEMIRNSKVFKTITYELACMRCSGTKLKVLKYGKKGKLLEIEEFVKKEATKKHLNKILPTATEIPVRCPAQHVPYGKHLQIYYGYGFVRENKTQPRRLDESHKDEFITTQPVIYTDLSLKTRNI